MGANRARPALRAAGIQDVTGDLQASAPRMMLKIDRDVIGRLGITPQSPRICSLTCRRRAARCRQE